MVFLLNENALSLKKIFSFLGYSLGLCPNQDVFELSNKLILNNAKIEW
jgi:hypothetical protein